MSWTLSMLVMNCSGEQFSSQSKEMSQTVELLNLQPVQDVLSFIGNKVITVLTTSLSQSLESKFLTKQAHQQPSPIRM